MIRRYQIRTFDNIATITDTRSGRTVTATRQKGGISVQGKLPSAVKRAAYHAINRSAY